jgi:hypothetical protein
MIRARSRIPYWEEPFRLRDLPGLDRVPWHNPKNDAQEKTSTRSRYDVPDVLRLATQGTHDRLCNPGKSVKRLLSRTPFVMVGP